MNLNINKISTEVELKINFVPKSDIHFLIFQNQENSDEVAKITLSKTELNNMKNLIDGLINLSELYPKKESEVSDER